MKKYSLQELTDKFNQEYVNEEKDRITERTVRSYQTNNLIPKPERDGRNAVYGDEHLDKISRVKKLMSEGLTMQAIKSMDALGLDSPDNKPMVDAPFTRLLNPASIDGLIKTQMAYAGDASSNPNNMPFLSAISPQEVKLNTNQIQEKESSLRSMTRQSHDKEKNEFTYDFGDFVMKSSGLNKYIDSDDLLKIENILNKYK